MAKKIRLKLDDLSVKSFVTSVGVDEKENIKGGNTCLPTCETMACSCLCSIYPPTEDDPWDCTYPVGCRNTFHNC